MLPQMLCHCQLTLRGTFRLARVVNKKFWGETLALRTGMVSGGKNETHIEVWAGPQAGAGGLTQPNPILSLNDLGTSQEFNKKHYARNTIRAALARFRRDLIYPGRRLFSIWLSRGDVSTTKLALISDTVAFEIIGVVQENTF